jgi:DNA-binding CsgD family transcriptional regulator
VLQELAELLVQSGLPELGEPNAREAVAIREREGDRVALVAARRTLAASLWQQTRWAEAIVLEDRTIADLEPHGPSPELVSALARRASSNMLAEGDIPRAVEMVARAREMAVQNGYDARLYDADEGQVLATAGEVESGLRILDDSWRARLRSPRHSGDRREGRFLLHHAVALRNLMGRRPETLSHRADSPPVPHAQDSADVSLAVVQAEALWAHGEIARARAVFDSLDLARLEHNVVPWVQCVRSELLFAAGELAAAAASARTAMPRHWQPTSHIRAAWEIRILVSAGDVQHALELAGRIQSVRSYGADFVLPLLDAAVEAHLAAGDVATAERLAKWAAGTLATNPYRSRIRGLRQMADGDPAGASSSFRASAVAFLATGHRQNEWHSRRLLANALQATGQRAAADAELRLVEREIADAGGTSPLGKPVLSRREREVAWLVAQGMRNREIGARLFISERTVENHIHRILERTQLRSRAELAAYVTRLGAELSGIPE